MFLVRGLAVSFSIFFLVYAGLSLAVAAGSKAIVRLCRAWRSPRRVAGFLFWMRVLPLAAALSVTVLVVVPSFLLLEPRAESEELSLLSVVLGCAGLGAVLFGLRNAAFAVRQTARVVRGWRLGAQAFSGSDALPVFLMNPEVRPACAIAGIVHPEVFVSKAAVAVLSGAELESVIRHEVVHGRRWDNLRKLLFRVCAFPGMGLIADVWADATEAAADEAAVSSSEEALDLAAALVKISRLVAIPGARPEPELTMALVQPGTALPARVERLVGWRQPEAPSARLAGATYLSGLVAAGMCALLYGPILACAHAATEWLVTR